MQKGNGEKIKRKGEKMEYIKTWLKTILYMNILLLICDNLMQKTAYEKYYRFFSGFLLVLCLLRPVIDLAGTEKYFQASFLQEEWKSERNLLKNAEEFRGIETVIKKEKEASYKSQIEELADQYGLQIEKAEVRWDTSGEKIKKIKIKAGWQEKEKGKQTKQTSFTRIQKLKEVLVKLYELKEEDISIEI